MNHDIIKSVEAKYLPLESSKVNVKDLPDPSKGKL